MKKFIGVLFVMALASCKQSATRTVPAESCAAQYTGQARDTSYFYYTCVSFNSQGACTVNVPVFVNQTSRETMVVCTFTEWRTEG